jgi:hypothetical protein
MANTRKGATVPDNLFSSSPDSNYLFSIRAGVDLKDALEQASCFLATALCSSRDLAMELSEEGWSDSVWAPYYLIEMSKAVVDAAISAACTEQRSEGGVV